MTAGRRNSGLMDGSSLRELADRVTAAPGIQARAAAEVTVVPRRRYQWQGRTVDHDELLAYVVPVPLTATQIPLAAGAGTLVSPDTLGPHDGFAWDVRRLTAASFTAGTVTAYLNYQADENILLQWTQAGSFFIGGGAVLGDTDAIIFTASGITGAVTVSGQAYNVPTPLLPEYLL